MTARCADPDWRTRHCAEPAAEQVLKATGEDPWAALGGCPRSWREAADLYRRLGVTNLKDAVTAVLGAPIACKHARRNDVAMVDGALGIVRGELVECIDRMQPIGRADCAWRIK
jgi:hypothetical protein